jgi:hypothetical protein
VRGVLRSGSYLTHDSIHYERVSPFGTRIPGDRLRPALEAWGAVLSRPEPGLAIVGFGNRDVPYDLDLPLPGLVRSAAQDMLLPALLLTMVAGIILGMGMPTTPAYIVQVALLVPALVRLGVPLEAAHMFVFYFAILSAITPPVAIAVYAAAGLSQSGIWDTSWDAVKLGLTGYIIPFMFVFGPALLMIGEWSDIALAVVTAMTGVALLAGSLTGYFLKPANWLTRVLFFAAAMVLIKTGATTDAIGLLLGGLGIFINVKWPGPEMAPRPMIQNIGPVEAPVDAGLEPGEILETQAETSVNHIRQGSS